MTLDLAEILRRAQSPRLVSGETDKLEFIKMRTVTWRRVKRQASVGVCDCVL